MSWKILATLSDRCRDPAVSVKKKALQCVGELLTVGLERKRERLFQNEFNTIYHFFRLNQNAKWPRRHGSRVWCQQWLTLRAQCRTKLWRFWTRCCSVRSSCILPTATWTPVRDLPGIWWICSVTSARISGPIFSIRFKMEMLFHLHNMKHEHCYLYQLFFPVDISARPSPSGPNRTNLHQHLSPTWFRTSRLSMLLGPGCCSLWLFHHHPRYHFTRSWMPGTTWSGGMGALFYLPRELGMTPHDLCKNTFDISSKDISVTTCCHILCVMGDIAAHLNEDTKARIVGKWWRFNVSGKLNGSDIHDFCPCRWFNVVVEDFYFIPGGYLCCCGDSLSTGAQWQCQTDSGWNISFHLQCSS